MNGTYNLWLVACSWLVAVAASYAALELAGRVAASSGRAGWTWLGAGSVAMGLGIWSMHFIGMLAFHLPIPLTYDLSVTALSVVPAILASALALRLIRKGNLSGARLAAGAALMGGGIAAMHYTGMAAIPVVPAIRYDPLIFAASIAVAIAVAYIALWLAFSLSGSRSSGKKLGAALVMGAAVCAMHYTGMAAAIFAPESICVTSATAIGGRWLAETVALNTMVILLAVLAIAVLDARRSDQTAQAAQALESANAELRRSEARFRDLTELSSDWYWEQDEHLRFTWLSGGVLKKLGWDPSAFIGKHRWDFPLIVDDRALAEHKALLAARQPFHDFAYGRSNADGSMSYVSASGMPVFDTDGRFRGYRGVGRDITERKRAEQALRDAHQKLADSVAILERRNREAALLSEMSNFLLACASVEEACEVIAKFCEKLFPSEHGTLFLARTPGGQFAPSATWGAPERNVSFPAEDCWALRAGRAHHVSDARRDTVCPHVLASPGSLAGASVCVPLIMQGEVLGVLWVAFESRAESTDKDGVHAEKRQLALALSEQIVLLLSNIRLRENLRQQSVRDPLTGLYNRRFLEESLAREIARSQRKAASFALLMLDIDHFKRFNDTFGHDAGDAVLRQLALTLRKCVRESDIVCRFGGEEFVVVLPEAHQTDGAVRAKTILETMRNSKMTHESRALGAVTVSIGLAMYPAHGTTTKTLLLAADKALYAAKGAGRDCVMLAV